jgi:hypothetical protein
MFGFPDLEGRRRRRSLVQLTYTGSLGRSPALSAHLRKIRIAVLILGKQAPVTRSRHGTRPRRQSSTFSNRSHPIASNASIAVAYPFSAAPHRMPTVP